MAAMTHEGRAPWSQRGAELVEFALVLPILLLVIMGIIDFGFAFQRYQVITNAAREGARVGVLPGYDSADIQARVDAYVEAAGLEGRATTTVRAVSIPDTRGGAAPGVEVTVIYTHTYVFLGPIISLFQKSPEPAELRAVSTMRIEAATVSGG